MLAAQIFYSASAASLAINAVPGRGIVAVPRVAQPIVMEEAVIDEAFGASHTSFYTDAVKKEKYDTLEEVLAEKLADKELATVVNTMFDACGTITEALRKELVTVADEQSSVFGDVQLGVDVVADDLMWDICKTEPMIKDGASEEEPEVREMHADGKFCVCWDPLDGSGIVDNNWAVGTILGIWPSSTGILGATGRDQVASLVALYGPRTTVFVTLDDGVYEFTYGANGVDGWICSRERIEIAQESKIFAPANMRAAQDLPNYSKLIDYWMTNKYTLRYSGGLVPDICQQFTKRMGVFANPTSEKPGEAPPGLRGGALRPPRREVRRQDLRRRLRRVHPRYEDHRHRPAHGSLHRLSQGGRALQRHARSQGVSVTDVRRFAGVAFENPRSACSARVEAFSRVEKL